MFLETVFVNISETISFSSAITDLANPQEFVDNTIGIIIF